MIASGGFLPTRGSWMLDFVVTAMVVVVVVMTWSLYLVRVRKQFQLHKRIQIALGIVLLIAVTAFEIDMRFVTDWRSLADASPYFTREGFSPVWGMLLVHLAFAVPTTLLWIATITLALRRFPNPVRPSPHSRRHRLLGRAAMIGMWGTAITGWLFYYFAFVVTRPT